MPEDRSRWPFLPGRQRRGLAEVPYGNFEVAAERRDFVSGVGQYFGSVAVGCKPQTLYGFGTHPTQQLNSHGLVRRIRIQMDAGVIEWVSSIRVSPMIGLAGVEVPDMHRHRIARIQPAGHFKVRTQAPEFEIESSRESPQLCARRRGAKPSHKIVGSAAAPEPT